MDTGLPSHPCVPRRIPYQAMVCLALVCLTLAACEKKPPPPKDSLQQAQQVRSAADPVTQGLETPVILVLGDSLTAGFGLPEEENYPSLLQNRLRENGFPHRVVNGGVSGDTSAGGLARLDWLFRQRVDILLVALGGNDGLRGLSPESMRENLARIIQRAEKEGARVLLAGMKIPTNYGKDYRGRFEAVYPNLAKEYGVALVPFLLEDVAAVPGLNQPDGIHPNTEGARKVAETVWPHLKALLESL